MGRRFTLQTDHKNLLYLQQQKTLSGKVARWSQFLNDFDFGTVYIPGSRNVVADALSRPPAALGGVVPEHQLLQVESKMDAPPLLKVVKAAQYEDPAMKAILEGQPAPSVMWAVNEKTGVVAQFDTQWGWRIAVPEGHPVRKAILAHFHDHPLSGHLGTQRTLQRVKRCFTWPQLGRDLYDYVRACHICQTVKPTNAKPAGLLQPYPPPPHPSHTVTLDLITQLPRTRFGNDAVVVFVDHLTKVAHMAPTTTTVTAPKLARIFMHEVIRLHGVPRVLLSDRDPRFTGAFWRELCQQLTVDCRFSTAFHPQTDGLTERMNRTIEQIIRAYVGPTHRDWDAFLDTAEYAYNSAQQESTKHTPFELLYRSNPRHPLELFKPSPASTTAPAVAELTQTLEHNLAKARTAILQAQAHQQAQADKHHKDIQFEEGDHVLLSTVNLPIVEGVRKFRARWIRSFSSDSEIVFNCIPPSTPQWLETP